MKLKRILAGVTACTIVGSTMLAMPASATTTTKAGDVKIFDVMNAAKTIAEMDVSDDVKSTLLDKFDTNGNGRIDMTELIAMAQRVAKLNNEDIVNEYGTADATTTTEATTTEATTTEATTTEATTTEATTTEATTTEATTTEATTTEATTTEATTTEATTTTEDTTTTEETTTEATTTEATTTEATTTEATTTEATTTEETTTEATTTTAALEPTVMVDGTEYADGDTVVVDGGASKAYTISVADENYENATATLTGETDKDGNDIIAVSGNRFSVISSGKLTITVTVPDTDLKKTITLNFKVKTSIALDENVAMGYTKGTGTTISDEYKALVEETKTFPDTGKTANEMFKKYGVENGNFEQLWAALEGETTENVKISDAAGENVLTGDGIGADNSIEMGVGETATLTGFTKYNEKLQKVEKYDTTDTVEYVSENSSIVAVDKKTGVITVKKATKENSLIIKIMIFVNGDYVASCNVEVKKEINSISFSANDGTTEYAEKLEGNTIYSGTYSTEVTPKESKSQAASLYAFRNEFQHKDAIQSISIKTADGKAPDANDIIGTDVYYFYDANTGDLYYVITNKTGVGSFSVAGTTIKVLDADQYKKHVVVPAGALTVEINGVKATAEDAKVATLDAYLEEGQVLNIADIASVEGVDSANVDVSVSVEEGKNANVTYKAVQGTITAGKFTDADFNNSATVTISYGDEKDTDNYRKVTVNVTIVKPVAVKKDIADADYDANGGTIYVAKNTDADEFKNAFEEELKAVKPGLSKAVDKDGNAKVDAESLVTDEEKAWTYSVDNEDMVTVDKDGLTITPNDKYKAKAGDKVTITATHAQGYTVSYTIEIVEKYPSVVAYRLANTEMTIPTTDTSIKGRAFDSLIEAKDIPSGCTVGIEIVGNADGVAEGMYYVNANGDVQNNKSQVDASAIKLVEKGDGLYTLDGFRTAAYSADKAGKTYGIKVQPVVYDANGIVIAKGGDIELTIAYAAATVVEP